MNEAQGVRGFIAENILKEKILTGPTSFPRGRQKPPETAESLSKPEQQSRGGKPTGTPRQALSVAPHCHWQES